MNSQGIRVFFGEADPVVADAETLLASVALERLDIAGVGLGQTVDGREYVHGDVPGTGGDAGFWAGRRI